ncbi:hypothetical protein HaLaN_03142 [Haematococcus lacustris]|uniref:Uncharacterized protein n=1 Tax=Haematococcus lacustris TaxID=44745 RepID=A0A699YYP5_HAELA|nr:hypothetical protein HaLaN_03142 [Haematococcus lacustris]
MGEAAVEALGGVVGSCISLSATYPLLAASVNMASLATHIDWRRGGGLKQAIVVPTLAPTCLLSLGALAALGWWGILQDQGLAGAVWGPAPQPAGHCRQPRPGEGGVGWGRGWNGGVGGFEMQERRE